MLQMPLGVDINGVAWFVAALIPCSFVVCLLFVNVWGINKDRGMLALITAVIVCYTTYLFIFATSSSVDYIGSKPTPFVEGRYYRAFADIIFGHVLRIISETGCFKKIVSNRILFANITLCFFSLLSIFITFYKPHTTIGEIVFLLTVGVSMVLSENIRQFRESSLIKNSRIIISTIAKKTYPLYLYQEVAFMVMGMFSMFMAHWNPFLKGIILICICVSIAFVIDLIVPIIYKSENIWFKKCDR